MEGNRPCVTHSLSDITHIGPSMYVDAADPITSSGVVILSVHPLLRARRLSNRVIPGVAKSRVINKPSLFGCGLKPVKELKCRVTLQFHLSLPAQLFFELLFKVAPTIQTRRAEGLAEKHPS